MTDRINSQAMELKGQNIRLEAETSSLRQLSDQQAAETSSLLRLSDKQAEDLKASREELALKEKKLEEVLVQLLEAQSKLTRTQEELEGAEGKLEEAVSSFAKQKEELEADVTETMEAGADAWIDGFKAALEQVHCVLPDLDLTQFTPGHSVADGKLIPPP
ncbi:hypothetical protein VNO80_01183 [Phaseolus coccineus]|uniref:Uncharacterized protein n=1 Tax=Phaseolus coccineus TaxID=3886 RepID=A0AAN9P0W2_PHACN